MEGNWAIVKELVADALERPPAERDEFLAAACADQPALLAEARALLQASTDAEDFLSGGAEELLETGGPSPAVGHLRAGDRLGAFEIVDLLGEGGFSDVYRAVQHEPIEREVALKRLKPGMDTRALLLRFDAERRTLARMNHPHIARVLDAGASDDGRPFVVMDLVRGVPITQHVTATGASLDERLDLFLQVCDAVEHAHRRGVIHRDLKPSNVLVEQNDGAGRVQVIDFGIARLFDDDAPAQTAEGMFLGTPTYASPEQLAGATDDLDTRVDVYALGVLLYELLTGARPSDRSDGEPRSVHELLEQIRAHAPLRPSLRLQQRRGTRTAGGDTTTARNVRAVRGELDWIALRALEADRDRRYPSVRALADDLRRGRRGEPVEAGPPSVTYRIRRLARRHRALFAAAALALLALAGGGAAALVGFLRASEARDEAEAAFRESEAVSEFLGGMLTSANPDQRGQDVTVLEILDGADEEFRSRPLFAEFPSVEARLRTIIGASHLQLGAFDVAELHLTRAEAMSRELFGDDDERRLLALFRLAQLRSQQTRDDEAERLMAEFAELAPGTFGEDHEYLRDLGWFRARGLFERGELDAARDAMQELVARDEASGDVVHLVTALGNLSQAHMKAGDADRARAAAERAWDVSRDALGPTHTRTILAGRSFGMALVSTDVERAGEVLRTTAAASRERYGPEHYRTLGIENYLAFALQQGGQLDDAAALYLELIPKQEAALGAAHRQTLMALHNLGMIQQARDDLAAARATLTEALQRFRSARGDDHPETLTCEVHLLSVRSDLEGPLEVAEEFARVVERHTAAYGAPHPQAREARADWAHHLLQLSQAHDRAQQTERVTEVLELAYETFRNTDDAAGLRKAVSWLIEAHRAYDRGSEAARWQAVLDALPATGGR